MKSKKLKGGSINIFSKKKDLKKIKKNIKKDRILLILLVDIFKYFITKNRSASKLISILDKIRKNTNLYKLLLIEDLFNLLENKITPNNKSLHNICIADNYIKNLKLSNIKINYLDICGLLLSIKKYLDELGITKKIDKEIYEDFIDDNSKISKKNKEDYIFIINNIINYINEINSEIILEKKAPLSIDKKLKPINIVEKYNKNSALASILLCLLVNTNNYIHYVLNYEWSDFRNSKGNITNNSAKDLQKELKIFKKNIRGRNLYYFDNLNRLLNKTPQSLNPNEYLENIFLGFNDCIIIKITVTIKKTLKGIPDFKDLNNVVDLRPQIELVYQKMIVNIDNNNLKNNMSLQDFVFSKSISSETSNELNITYNVIYDSEFVVFNLQRQTDYILNTSQIKPNYEIKLKSGKLLYLNAVIIKDIVDNIHETFLVVNNEWYYITNSKTYTKIGSYQQLINFNEHYIEMYGIMYFYSNGNNQNKPLNTLNKSNNDIIKEFEYLNKRSYSTPWSY